MTWRILNEDGWVVEKSMPSSGIAQRALWVLTAHEVANGRAPHYRIDPPIPLIDLYPIEDLHLPDWALQALEASS